MRRTFPLIAFAAVLVSAPAAAENDEVLRGPLPSWAKLSEPLAVPDDAGGLLFVRRQDTEIHLDEDGQAAFQGYRIRILHQNALQLGNVSIMWNPAAGAPTVHDVRIYRGSSVIDVLEHGTFEILRREDQLEAAALDGMLTAVMRVPDLRVGDELEVDFTTRTKEPTLGTDSFGVLFLAPEPAPGRYHLLLGWEDGQEPAIKITPDLAGAANRRTGQVEFRFDNPGLEAPPKDAPPRYRWQRIVEYSDYADWQAISRRFAPLFAAAARLDPASPLKEEAARIKADNATPLARANAALKLVQQQVRYIYVGLDGGNYQPATADQTWQRRYGDCKAKTALLLALLAQLGIDAEAVAANNSGSDDGLDQRLPSPGMFDHVLVRAHIEGEDYWLDGTLPPVVPAGHEPIVPYRWVLPFTAQGSPIVRVPWQAPARPTGVWLYEIDVRDGFDKPAKMTDTSILRGLEGLRQQVQLSALTPAQLLSALRQELVGNEWQTIDAVEWHYDVAAAASVLKISGTGPVDWDDDGDGAKSLNLPGGGFNPPERRARPADQDQELPYYVEPEYDCRVTTVRLPETTQPSQWRYNTSYDTHMFGRDYHRAFEKRGAEIRMVRGTRVEENEIDAATARADNARIAGFDNSMAWIYYDPNRTESVRRSAVSVPATYEIDWTADNVPCLANGD